MKVLDVGSGARPHSSATHLCDAFQENLERGADLRTDGRPFVLAHIESLPFKDGAFDFVYAVHVLEHSARPEAALREIVRVAKGGYIETPSPFAERLYGWDHHRCTVGWRSGGLKFGPKILPQRTLDCHALYRRSFAWKGFHKGLDILFNVLYVRVLFKSGVGGPMFRRMGRSQAIRDLFLDPMKVGAGPSPPST